MQEFSSLNVLQNDGYQTKVTCLYADKKPLASILILHGMAEHQKRYFVFAQYLCNLGYDVFLYDHRGHGVDKKINELGFIAARDGYKLLIQDAITVSQEIEKQNRGKKFFLFAHSMGSLIARNVLYTYQNYTGVILSGTANSSRLTLRFGLCMTSFIKKYKGPKHISPYTNNLLFGSKKYLSLANRTSFDWLTRSNTIVGNYIHDPYCGFICSASFYDDLLRLTYQATSKRKMKHMKTDMPLYIISGEMDPVSGFSKDVKRLLSSYDKIGLTHVSYKFYPDARHELVNELNYELVYQDIMIWLHNRAK